MEGATGKDLTSTVAMVDKITDISQKGDMVTFKVFSDNDGGVAGNFRADETYLFIQGGSSGTSDDTIIKVSEGIEQDLEHPLVPSASRIC